MKLLHILHRNKGDQALASQERARLERSMPGETGALAALRLGVLIN